MGAARRGTRRLAEVDVVAALADEAGDDLGVATPHSLVLNGGGEGRSSAEAICINDAFNPDRGEGRLQSVSESESARQRMPAVVVLRPAVEIFAGNESADDVDRAGAGGLEQLGLRRRACGAGSACWRGDVYLDSLE